MKRELVPIILLNLVNVLGFAILIPVFPFIIEEFGGNEVTYGVLLAMYPLFQFLGAPALGSLSDTYGRRPILLISQFGTLVSWVIMAVALLVPNMPAVFGISYPLLVIGFARVVDGITGGNFSVANAYVADITAREHKTKIFGIIGSIVGLGLVLGPVLGGAISSSSWGFMGVIIFSGILSLVTLLLMQWYLPETLAVEKRAKLTFHIIHDVNVYTKLQRFKKPVIKQLFFIRGFFALVFSAYTSTVVLLMKDSLGLSMNAIGLLFVVLGGFFIINQAIVVPTIAHKYGNLFAFYVGQAAMVVGLSLVMFADSVLTFLSIAYIINLGFSASFPTFKSMITDLVDDTRQGEITGLDESVLAGASAIAPIVAGSLYVSFAGRSYMLYAVFLIIPHIILWFRMKRMWILLPDN